MAVLLDTGILYAYYDRGDAWHRRARALVRTEEASLIVPSPLIPEVDRLLGKRLGAKARVGELNRQFPELELSFVDVAVVAIAEVPGLTRIATTNRRDFVPMARALALELLP